MTHFDRPVVIWFQIFMVFFSLFAFLVIGAIFYLAHENQTRKNECIIQYQLAIDDKIWTL